MSSPSLARRVWPAVALAGVSAAFLASLDKPTSFSTDEVALTGAQDTASGVTVVPTVPPSPTVLPVPEAVPASTALPDPGAAPAPVTAPIATVPIATVPPPPTTIAPAPAPAGACTAAPIDGPVVNTRWGPVQVQATLTADGTVCQVKALATPNSHRRSVQINNQATPILHDRAVAAGNATFQSVSGATITSKGYKASLQSILDNN